jgi:hypothetical protein
MKIIGIQISHVKLQLEKYIHVIYINLDESVNVQVWLSTPPHRINGNDTVRIQWNDCFTWTSKELSFNSENFQEKQILTKHQNQCFFFQFFMVKASIL